MTIFNFYLFNRDGACILYKEWNREKKAGMSMEQVEFVKFSLELALC